MSQCSRTGRDPARARRGRGGHAEHGAVLAAGVKGESRDGERRTRSQPALQARLLRKRVQRPARARQAAARLSSLPRL